MKQVVDLNEIVEIKKILEENFGKPVDHDPFVHYIKYDTDHLKGILSYSLIYERIELNYIWVAFPYRRQGVGSLLLDYLQEIGKEKGVENISLEVECENSGAIQFYQKYGYQVVAKRKNYYHGKDGYLMVKEVK